MSLVINRGLSVLASVVLCGCLGGGSSGGTENAGPVCNQARAAEAVEALTKAKLPDEQWQGFALDAVRYVCARASIALALAGATDVKNTPQERQKIYGTALFGNLPQFDRGCPTAKGLLKDPAWLKGETGPLVTLATKCKFVDLGILSQAELDRFAQSKENPESVLAPYVPIFRAAMVASKIDPGPQRVLLRALLMFRPTRARP